MTSESGWSKYSRFGLDLASTATSIGFSTAKAGTKLGFSIARGVASTTAYVTGTALDYTLFGGIIGAGPLLSSAVSTTISAVELVALAPILLGESLTSTSLIAAQASIDALSTFFPGSDEASFSLTHFVKLVRRELEQPQDSHTLPEDKYGLAQTLRALTAWAILQGVTREYQEKRWLRYMKEIHVGDEDGDTGKEGVEREDEGPYVKRERRESQVHITTDVLFPRDGGQIVAADIGEASPKPTRPSKTRTSTSRSEPTTSNAPGTLSNVELKQKLRRFSKLVLAGYGGAPLIFFGVSPSSFASGFSKSSTTSLAQQKQVEEAKLSQAIDASEAEASGSHSDVNAHSAEKSRYSWWNVLLGRHDRDIVLDYLNSERSASASTSETNPQEPLRPPTAISGTERLMPRFWVITDHARREVVLAIRGTMSLNELAVDLTCDSVPIELNTSTPKSRKGKATAGDALASVGEMSDTDGSVMGDDEDDEDWEIIPGAFPVDISKPDVPSSPLSGTQDSVRSFNSSDSEGRSYLVHGGMLKLARAMGEPGKPVHVVVRNSLRRNKGYSLVLCGHSLGAGVAALLAIMWTDPHTCLTHPSSGLPPNRRTAAYCFASPCLVSTSLSNLVQSTGLITSLVYSYDIVSRLSLGSVIDMQRAAVWLCEAEAKGPKGEGFSGLTTRALKWKARLTDEDEEDEWFIAMRTTLEANMHQAHLFPPGRILWVLRDADLHPTNQLRTDEKGVKGTDKVRMFEVLDVERVFGQIVFSKNMLNSHLPHQYDHVLHELL